MRLKLFYHWNRTGRLVCMLKWCVKSLRNTSEGQMPCLWCEG